MAYCANYIEQNLSGRRDALSASGESVATHFFGQSSFSSYANVVAHSVVTVDLDVPLEMIGSLGCGLRSRPLGLLPRDFPAAGDISSRRNSTRWS